MDYKADSFTNRGVMILTDKDAFGEHIRRCEKAMYSLAFSIDVNCSDSGEINIESIY